MNDGPFSVLVVDDDAGVRKSMRLCLEAEGARMLGVATGSGAIEALERARFDLVFLDLWLGADSGMDLIPEILRLQPGLPIVVVTAHASFESAVQAIKRGATDYLPKPFEPEEVRLALRRALEATRLKRRICELEERIEATHVEDYFDTASATFRNFLGDADRAAHSGATILIRGESGTGKNVLVSWLRIHSSRAKAPLISVNCPTLSSDLMSSALFGHKRGAFTGAIADAVGKVQEAEGGTLFLDEVGDLSPDAQARLLRFLNDHSYERLGEARERKADVRVFAATNRRLEDDVRAGRFREDLLYRLNVVTLTVPPLRDRREDIVALAKHYLRFFERGRGHPAPPLSAAAERALVEHDWPGNLRELRNAVERAAILARGSQIAATDLGLLEPLQRGPESLPVELGGNVSLDALEREHIARVLARAPTLEAAARTLGIDVTTLTRKRKRYGLA
jgi:NtrC-family two-component system response regulator AlgB